MEMEADHLFFVFAFTGEKTGKGGGFIFYVLYRTLLHCTARVLLSSQTTAIDVIQRLEEGGYTEHIAQYVAGRTVPHNM